MDDNLTLLNDEHVVWRGVPHEGFYLRPADAFLIPFSLMWGGFAIYWNIGVWSGNAPTAFALFGLPFLAGGLYLTIGRFLHDAYLRRKLRYFVTDRRILIARAGASSMKSLDVRRLPVIEMDERADGSGTIRFGATSFFAGGGRSFGYWVPALSETPQFVMIDSVRTVYDTIQRYANMD